MLNKHIFVVAQHGCFVDLSCCASANKTPCLSSTLADIPPIVGRRLAFQSLSDGLFDGLVDAVFVRELGPGGFVFALLLLQTLLQ